MSYMPRVWTLSALFYVALFPSKAVLLCWLSPSLNLFTLMGELTSYLTGRKSSMSVTDSLSFSIMAGRGVEPSLRPVLSFSCHTL